MMFMPPPGMLTYAKDSTTRFGRPLVEKLSVVINHLVKYLAYLTKVLRAFMEKVEHKKENAIR
ncbi:hypothetical protein U1Q18_046865, partial [Sarracenia purpurea var. burkii]